MKPTTRWLTSLVATMAMSGSAPAITYLVDDGSGESNLGIAAVGSFCWMNHFLVQPGSPTIVSISGAFGPVPNGSAITAHLWSDPNGDGNPYDAVSISSGSQPVANANSDTFNTFAIPTITMPVGTSFFAGFRMSHDVGMRPARLDTTEPQGESWIAFTNNQNNLGGALNLQTDGGLLTSNPNLAATGGRVGNWMVRANAVPEPASLLAMGLGAGLLLRRRRAA